MERSYDGHALLGMTGFVVFATSEEGEPLVLVDTTRSSRRLSDLRG